MIYRGPNLLSRFNAHQSAIDASARESEVAAVRTVNSSRAVDDWGAEALVPAPIWKRVVAYLVDIASFSMWLLLARTHCLSS